MIYVCIPARDEASTLGVLLWKVRKVLGDFGRDYHILVHDDASSDDTAAVLERYRRTLPLTVLRSEEPLGYARATERLLKEAVRRAPYPKRDCAVVLQGDFTDDPADIVPLVKALEGGADVVQGSVEEEDPAAPREMRWLRRAAPWVLGRTHRRAPVADPLNGLRVYRVIVLKKAIRDDDTSMVDERSGTSRWSANLELLRQVAPHARRIEECPVSTRYGLLARESRFRPFPVLKDLLRLRGGGWPAPGPDDRAA